MLTKIVLLATTTKSLKFKYRLNHKRSNGWSIGWICALILTPAYSWFDIFVPLLVRYYSIEQWIWKRSCPKTMHLLPRVFVSKEMSV
jgi:hypothetical protein